MSMIIDGVFASEAIDSSGEILDIEGCDISDMEAGHGTINWEHRGEDSHGASANDIIGKVVFCKKIYGPEDCTDDRQLDYWQKIQLPLIYGICRLFDSSGHPGAIAAAAMIRDYQANAEPLLIRYSIEGTTLEKEKGTNVLKRSIARRVAATIKPCNKSCFSGVIADPGAKDMQKKEEFSHPNYTPLGGSFEYDAGIVESGRIHKALEAGGYNVAPNALVGGSALQVEDRSLKNRVKAAVRDWDKKTPFKTFLKHRLPEVSDEFCDRFSGLVQDYTIKKAQKEAIKQYLLQKIEEKAKAKGLKSPKTAGATRAKKPDDATVEKPLKAPKDPNAPLTIRGVPVPPNPQLDKPHFDESTGILHTPKGSFPMYIPSRDQQDPEAGAKFAKIMNDPTVNRFHDYAMSNWVKVHQHLKNGTLPPEVVMHGVLFSQLSPNTPVPMQELMYGHLVDSMRATGTDPRSPKGLDQLRSDWMKRDRPDRLPENSPDHWARLKGIILKRDSKAKKGKPARNKGEIGSFMLANNKFKNMAKYHTLHDGMVELVNRHRENARAGVSEMMYHKTRAELHEAQRGRDRERGLPDQGPYAAGPSVPGLATKTSRYTYGMLGGGNVTVPDTHFSRYLFGLDKKLDSATIQHIRDTVLWNPNNSHIMDGLDRYYGQHHDAVKHMLAHPIWGKHFSKPEDAIFPAFWKNWVGIVPHEASRGLKTGGFNDNTDHKPFWDAVTPYLQKTEDATGKDTNLAMRTAQTHAEWAEKYGEMTASLMYYHYLVPQLLAASEQRQKEETIAKMDFLAKAADGGTAPAKGQVGPVIRRKVDIDAARVAPLPETVQFNGKTVKPGHGTLPPGLKATPTPVAFLSADKTHLTAVPREKINNWEASDLIRVPRTHGPSVERFPQELDTPSIVSAEVHAHPAYTRHDDVKAMLHGLDLDGGPDGVQAPTPVVMGGVVAPGINSHKSRWTKDAQGNPVYLKPQNQESEFDEVDREGLYHNLARDFYGMGQYSTPTGSVMHPATGQKFAVVQGTKDGQHFSSKNPEHVAALQRAGQSGDLHKMAIMNYIANNHDRHEGNFMMTPDGMKLIDHGYAFDEGSHDYTSQPDYLTLNNKHTPGRNPLSPDPIHPEARKWLAQLNPKELEMQMMSHGIPERFVMAAKKRLKTAQAEGRRPDGSMYSIFRADGGNTKSPTADDRGHESSWRRNDWNGPGQNDSSGSR